MNLQETTRNYHWITANGDRLKLSEMTTLHLGNVLRMLWNHVCYRFGGSEVPESGTYSRFTEMAENEPEKMLDLCLILRHVIDRRPDVYTLDPWYPRIIVQLADGHCRNRHGQLLNGARTHFTPICEFYETRATHSWRSRPKYDQTIL